MTIKWLASVIIVCATYTPGSAQTTNHIMVTPADLTWSIMPTLPPGALVAIIQGPVNESRPFVLRLKLPANYDIPAHWHPWVEHATVISGTLNMGIGDKLDRSRTKALVAGSIAVINSNTNHFSWTSEETIVQVHGTGPLVIHYVNPADDPRKK
jgi:quercetin dioxygenase-like cupin family protein